jgi:hypothetical protein
VFSYNPKLRKFELGPEDVRIEGCSARGVSGYVEIATRQTAAINSRLATKQSFAFLFSFRLLQDIMDIGTHMRRLVRLTDSCVRQIEYVIILRTK